MTATETLAGIVLFSLFGTAVFAVFYFLFLGIKRIFWRSGRKDKLGLVQLHESIKMLPLHNWEQMNLTNDMLWLLIDQKDRKRKIDPVRVENAYLAIYDEYATETGGHEKMDKWRDLMIMRMEARADLAQGDRSAQNRIDIYTDQIKQIMKSGGDTNVVKNRMLVQKVYGQPIKPLEITVYEYLLICKILEEAQTASTPTEDVESD